MNISRLDSGNYRVETGVGNFVVRKLQNVAATDFQWGVFDEQQKLREYGYTKADCISRIERWEEGQLVPAGRDYNFRFPDYLGSKRIDPHTYRMETPVGIFLIRKLDQRKRGDFRWGIFSPSGDFYADHFTRAECESLVREWVSHKFRPTPGPLPTEHQSQTASQITGRGCLVCIAVLPLVVYLIYRAL